MTNIRSGYLRTKIRIQSKVSVRKKGELESADSWIDIGADNPEDIRYKFCQYIGSHGSEAIRQDALSGIQSATLRLRYDARVDNTCRVLINDEIWNITGIDNIRRLNHWMEISIQRRISG